MTLFTRTARLWANSPLRVKGLMVVLLPVVAFLLSILLISQLEKQKADAEEWVKHTQDVRVEILNTYIVLVSAESSVRDYALTGHEEALQPYERAGVSIDVVLDRIRDLVRDNSEQMERLVRLKDLIHQRLEGLKALRGHYDSPQARGQEAPQQLLRQGQASMNGALLELTKLYTTEDRLLKDRTKKSKDFQTILYAGIVGSVVVGLLGGIVAAWLFTRGIARRVQHAELSAHHLEQGLPLDAVPVANDELGRLASGLQRTGAILAKQAEELKLALESGQVLIWELEPDSGHIRYQAGSEALKTARLPGELLPGTITEWLAVVHGDDRDYVRKELEQVLANGGSFQIEYRVVLGGGEIRWIAVKGQFHSEGNGRPRRLLGIKVDITERRKAAEEIVRQAQELTVSREALEQQTRILRSILDSMGDGVVVADENGKFLLFNPAAEHMVGFGALEATPKEWAKLYGVYGPDMAPYPVDQLPLVRAMRGEILDGVEFFIRNERVPQGAWLSANGRPLQGYAGQVSGGVVVLRDVSDNRRTEEILKTAKDDAEKANRAKSEFLSRMSHELRTPLNSILGFAQVLEMGDLAERSRDCIRHILKGGRHLLALIDEVLDISRIEAGKLALSSEPVQLTDAIAQAVDMVGPLAAASNIQIHYAALAPHQYVTADRRRLQQVLLNLISNAVKYNRRNGSVQISWENSSENRVRIQVSDNGIGISEEDQKRLFVPFERLGAVQTDIQGTGLGLALCRRLVESMGGIIGVRSAMGSGSTFWVELPAAAALTERMEHATAAVLSASPQGVGDLRTLLYVEDNVSNVKLMEHILTYRPHIKLLVAMQGRLGLDLAKDHRPDLIFLDLHLPDLTGDVVLRQLRDDPRTRAIPIVIISADATPGQVQRLLEIGATDYLTKPFDIEKLLRMLDENLSTQQGAINVVGSDGSPHRPTEILQ